MSSIGTGYDLSATTFSPDGRVFQVEYAMKAVDNSGTAIGVRCKDGIVLGVEKLVQSKLQVKGSNRRINAVDRHATLATTGLLADGRAALLRARHEAKQYKDTYRCPISGKMLTDRLSLFVQAYTLYSSVRPFGVAMIIGAYDRNGPSLYMIEPSGISFGYYGIAVGKGKQAAKTELEKIKWVDLTCEEAVKHVARIIHSVHDGVKDKAFELEMAWICPQSNNEHQMVPSHIIEEASRQAISALNDDEMED